MEATFLAHKKNWKRHCQKWTRKKLGIFCKAIVLTGSPVKETHLLLVTWEEAWKRQIHSAWSIFSSLMKTPSRCLNDNASRRGNSQLPVIDNGMNEWTLNDSCSYKHLSPVELLTVELKFVLIPCLFVKFVISKSRCKLSKTLAKSTTSSK